LIKFRNNNNKNISNIKLVKVKFEENLIQNSQVISL
jgi:hypothetical protein